MMVSTHIETPLGPMLACATDAGICLLEFTDREDLDTQLQRIEKTLQAKPIAGNSPHFDLLATELDAYFTGTLQRFTVPLAMGGSEFQKKVWTALLDIPYGYTSSYLKQSERVGNVKAIRAVAGANGDNHISIVIPCHRVIGSDGSLTGYGGGLWRKKWLLDHEAKVSGNVKTLF